MDTEENKQIMAQNIKYYMERKGVTNQQLCDALNFKYTTFLDWIKGVTYPRIGKVEAMAQYFGCEKSDLIERKKEQPPEGRELSEAKRNLLELVDGLTEDQAVYVLQVLKALLAAFPQAKPPAPVSDP